MKFGVTDVAIRCFAVVAVLASTASGEVAFTGPGTVNCPGQEEGSIGCDHQPPVGSNCCQTAPDGCVAGQQSSFGGTDFNEEILDECTLVCSDGCAFTAMSPATTPPDPTPPAPLPPAPTPPAPAPTPASIFWGDVGPGKITCPAIVSSDTPCANGRCTLASDCEFSLYDSGTQIDSCSTDFSGTETCDYTCEEFEADVSNDCNISCPKECSFERSSGPSPMQSTSGTFAHSTTAVPTSIAFIAVLNYIVF